MLDSLSTSWEWNLQDVYLAKIIPKPHSLKEDSMGNDIDIWCKYYKVRGHHNDDCHHLKQDIKKLFQVIFLNYNQELVF